MSDPIEQIVANSTAPDESCGTPRGNVAVSFISWAIALAILVANRCRSFAAPYLFPGIDRHAAPSRFRPSKDRKSEYPFGMGLVWTAPGWQEESSLCSIGRSSHVFGLFTRYA
ncbi:MULTISPECIES: hypothetical protein [unclassified Bradyrhizobium]|uniref:hypothetical protein n=1 Tax=unclassified Bradyrhizobium TaxID=2631580 RepID=UPI00247A779C|nr:MULTISPECIES: hypothetical protein [unclassified Bradyrhizobium]WGR73784.1 hypothetical protein MTX24_13645 [Bradyrhizobium sp. ISRA426]WGR78622.1 hypothetical protein MTX21_38615 [Bradyrhizobium sp. ISRA430]WGR89023.1 hypothetical protein MTX25_13660 [Bradyrhizobium sp. ISRA432]